MLPLELSPKDKEAEHLNERPMSLEIEAGKTTLVTTFLLIESTEILILAVPAVKKTELVLDIAVKLIEMPVRNL